MKTGVIILFMLVSIAGCGQPSGEKPKLVARINNYEIGLEEFEGGFKESPYGVTDTLESRTEFLNTLINKKLILQDAELRNLDKDKAFLAMIERFWEQSLLKMALEKKSREIAGLVSVNDRMVQERYQKMLSEGRADKPYDSVYNQIKWELTQEQESQLMNEWMDQLHKKAKIKVNYDLLKQDK